MSTANAYIETSFFVTGQAQTVSAFSSALNGSVPFSVTAWANFESVEDAADILSKNGVFTFGMQGRQLYVEITGFPALMSDGETNPITQDAWHYVACVYTGTTLQLYIDGILDSQSVVTGTGTDNSNPFLIANNLQGRLNSVRIYNTALTGAEVLQAMFQPEVAPLPSVANFDFTLNPPADTSGNNLLLTLTGNTSINTVTPAVGLLANAVCQPMRDDNVNPGGAGNDAYSIQAWIWVANPPGILDLSAPIPGAQCIFVNGVLDNSAGVALYLTYDETVQLYRLASLRGTINSPSNSLVSQATIPYGQWVNVATTYDPTPTSPTLALYINGQLDTSSNSFAAIPPLSAPDLVIGGAVLSSQPTATWTLQGYLQTVDVWNIALTGTQIQSQLTDYPVLEDGLTAHYDFSSHLARNENSGSPVSLVDRASLLSPSAPADSQSVAAGAGRPALPGEPFYAQLPPEELARLRASISFANVPHLEQLLDEAMQRELSANLHLFVPAALVPQFRARLAAEWMHVRHLMRTRPQALRYVITYHQLNGEHVLIHHTPVRSTVVFRAPLTSLDACTMWRIQVIWTIVAGLLAIFGVTGSLTTRAQQFIQNRILGNAALMNTVSGLRSVGITAAGLFTMIRALYSFGVLWPLIKIIFRTMGWWALTKLLVKILVRCFGTAAAAAEVIASLIVAVAQVIYVFSQQPSGCSLSPQESSLEPALA